MMTMLIAYDATGKVVSTLDCVVVRNADGQPVGMIDFDAHEHGGGEHTDIWNVASASGSKVWPEWLGAEVHDFDVELSGPSGRKHISALVHRTSGYRRERAAIEAAIQERIASAGGRAADIRDLVGGPGRPLLIDEQGRTKPKPAFVPSRLPTISMEKNNGQGKR